MGGKYSDSDGGDISGTPKILYYAILVFYEHDWTKGEGLWVIMYFTTQIKK